jgi:hypothetical protein
LEKFFAYDGTRYPPPSFYQIWNLLSFADLVAPDWKKYLKNNKNKKDIYRISDGGLSIGQCYGIRNAGVRS